MMIAGSKTPKDILVAEDPFISVSGSQMQALRTAIGENPSHFMRLPAELRQEVLLFFAECPFVAELTRTDEDVWIDIDGNMVNISLLLIQNIDNIVENDKLIMMEKISA